ncbi:MAG: HDOD domain-containing protein [Planctomycetes bacterium]|nr:HDOD domain-containing protein [Planctomycetota bacterium]
MTLQLRKILERVGDLPTLPQVMTRILSIVEDPRSSAKDLEAIMARDPALTARILRLVNSAYYGVTQRVSSLSQAVVILGFDTVRAVALTVSVFDAFGSKGGVGEFDRVGFWRHSIGSAVIYQALSAKVGGIDPESAFICGLLHDIGKLVLDRYAPNELRAVLQRAEERRCSFLDAEVDIVDTDHAHLGGWLLEKWRLSEDVVRWVSRHHSMQSEDGVRVAISHFADYLCKVKGISASGTHDEAHLDRAIWNRLGLQKQDLPTVIEGVNKELASADEFLLVAAGK